MNKVVHFEIPADDVVRAEKFYKEVFGWDIQKISMKGVGDYFIVRTVETDENQMPKEVGAINGGMIKREKAGETTIITIDVENLDEHLKKIKENGGKVVSPKRAIGDMGLYAEASDTEGNEFGVWQNLK